MTIKPILTKDDVVRLLALYPPVAANVSALTEVVRAKLIQPAATIPPRPARE